MSGWEAALQNTVNNFDLTRVGVEQCVGGFWREYNTVLIEENKYQIGSPVIVDEDLFWSLRVTWEFTVCVCLRLCWEEKDNTGGHLPEPESEFSDQTTLSLQSASRLWKYRFIVVTVQKILGK